MRTVKSLNPGVSKAIDDYEKQFLKILESFKNKTAIDSAVQVHRILDAVKTMSACKARK